MTSTISNTQKIMFKFESLPKELIREIVDLMPKHKYMNELKTLFKDCKDYKSNKFKFETFIHISFRLVYFKDEYMSTKKKEIDRDIHRIAKNQDLFRKKYSMSFVKSNQTIYYQDPFCKNNLKSFVNQLVITWLTEPRKKDLSRFNRFFGDDFKFSTKKELLSIAKENNIKISSSLTKQKIITKLFKSL